MEKWNGLRNEKQNWSRNIELMRKNSLCESGLYSAEQLAYFLEWYKKINPESNEFSLLYGGMGPDIASPLIMTDATTIIGVDQIYGAPIYGDDDFEGDIQAAYEEPMETYAEVLNWHQHAGFYSGDFFYTRNIGMPKLCGLDLRCLGVKLEDISISSGTGSEWLITFPWKHPTHQTEKLRSIHLKNGSVTSLSRMENIPPIDIYYEKSILDPSITRGDSKNVLYNNIISRIKDGGFVVIGTGQDVVYDPHNTEDSQRSARYRRKTEKIFQEDFSPEQWSRISISIEAKKQMLQKQKKDADWYTSNQKNFYGAYGWHLVGAQKKEQ